MGIHIGAAHIVPLDACYIIHVDAFSPATSLRFLSPPSRTRWKVRTIPRCLVPHGLPAKRRAMRWDRHLAGVHISPSSASPCPGCPYSKE
jgi:hypothetical protein